jgi:hypothetical protein
MGILFSLFTNKWVLGALAALLLCLGGAWGINSVHNAYAQRAALQIQVKQQLETIHQDDDQITGLASTIKNDQQDKQKLVDEIALRDKLATESATRNAQLTKDLKNANTTLAKWKSTASSAMQSCLNAPLPDGLFGGADENQSGSSDGNASQVRTPAGG